MTVTNRHGGDDELWRYNAQDCVVTRECGEVELATLKSLGLEEVERFQQSMFWPVLRAMNLGIRISKKTRHELAQEIQESLCAREEFLIQVLGHAFNPRSFPQMCKLFYDDLQQPPIKTRAKKGSPAHLTCDDEALQKIAAREPLLRPILNAIADIRTLQKWLNDFILAKTDYDDRMRCSFNICGAYTYRFGSSKNAFGSGANLQTIPSDKSRSVGKAIARGKSVFLPDFPLPNIRRLYVPDPGFTFFDLDLDRADLHVFVWEIGDEDYRKILKMGVDAHLLHVYLLDGKEPPPLDELVETHPKYPDHRGPRKHLREFSKVFCHATDYYGQARTVAAATGRSVHETDTAQKKYLQIHPGIKPYWERLQSQVTKHGFVANKYGYRWYIFDRRDQVLPDAIAWIPQSTVGVTINKIWKGFYDTIPEVQTLLQVHDSLAGQFPTHLKQTVLTRMRECAKVTIPYDDPLIIPVGIETSEISWGDCK